MSAEGVASNLGSLSIEEDPCSASSIISNIKKKYEHDPEVFVDELQVRDAPTFLRNYQTIQDENFNMPYIEAEVRLDCLDTGSDPNENGLYFVKRYKAPGDIPAQFICKKLGGDGFCRNVYPANPNSNLTESEIAQNMVYSHVKKGGDCWAKLFFGIKYEDDEENGKYFFRAKEIYYYFELYENDKILSRAIEGKINNMLP